MKNGKHCSLKVKSAYFGYSEGVKGYRLLQPHSHDIIIRRDVKFDENLLACKPILAGLPSLACEPDSTIVPSASSSSKFLDRFPTLVSNDDNEDENPPPPQRERLNTDGSFEPIGVSAINYVICTIYGFSPKLNT